MSYQGWASGSIYVRGLSPDQVTPVIEFLKELGAFNHWGFSLIEKTDSQLEYEIGQEIRYYFADDLEDTAKEIMDKFPGAYMQGSLYMSAENDVPYRLEIHRDGKVVCSDEVDWLLSYSCEDIKRIREWAEKNCKFAKE